MSCVIDIKIEKAYMDIKNDLCHVCCRFLLPFCLMQFLVYTINIVAITCITCIIKFNIYMCPKDADEGQIVQILISLL